MSTITTNLVQAVVDRNLRELDGRTLTRPVLRVSDGSANLTWCVDVDINQKRVDPNTGDEVTAVLRNVAIASGDQSLLYADIGAAVRLRRTDGGRWEVSGFSKMAPGSYVRVPVTIGTPGADPVAITVGTPVDITLSSRALTYGELADHGGGYGSTPYGAVGIFRGDELLEVR